jgi:hypothetical protein
VLFIVSRKYLSQSYDHGTAYNSTLYSCQQAMGGSGTGPTYQVIEDSWKDESGMVYPYCLFEDTDPDGDGWGWEYDNSCVVRNRYWVDPSNGATFPFCTSWMTVDPDGDGWASENGASCKVAKSGDMQGKLIWMDSSNGKSFPFCRLSSSNQGNGWGAENGYSCKVPTHDDMAEVIMVPGFDPNLWCQQNISCQLSSVAKSGRVVGGYCQPY